MSRKSAHAYGEWAIGVVFLQTLDGTGADSINGTGIANYATITTGRDNDSIIGKGLGSYSIGIDNLLTI